MRHGIVEGEPGIFPDPISRLLRLIGRPFRRDRDGDTSTVKTQEERRSEAGTPDDDRRESSTEAPPT